MRFKGDPYQEGFINKKDRPAPKKKRYSWYKYLKLPIKVAPGDKAKALRIIQTVGDYLIEHSSHLSSRDKRALRMILYRWRRRCRGANPYFNQFGTEPIAEVRKKWGFNVLPGSALSPEQRKKEESYQRRLRLARRRERV